MTTHTHAWQPDKASGQYRCKCGAVRAGVLTFAELAQAQRIDKWNLAMRSKSYKSRRKFILTGRV